MKKILFAAFAATLLAAGCQKTEVVGTTTTGSKMSFSTEMKKITKAEGDATTNPGELPDGNANLKENGFYVWAYADYDLDVNSNNVDTDSKIYDGMAGEHVEYVPETDDAGEYWDPGQEYYWPAEERNLIFFAVSAKEVDITNVNPEHGITDPYPTEKREFTGASLTINNFRVDDSDPSNDLMIADFRRQNSEQNGQAVNLNFNHALTKVQFVFSTTTNPYDANETIIDEATKVFVQKVEVTGLFNQGTLTVTPKEGTANKKETDDAEVSLISLQWDNRTSNYTGDNTAFTATWPTKEDNFPNQFEKEGAKGEYTESTTSDKKSLLLTDEPKSFATWFMLPQSLVDEDKNEKLVKITYVINQRQFSAFFPLTGSTNNSISDWGVNQYVKYNISLTPDMILFDAEVETWNPSGGEDESLQN